MAGRFIKLYDKILQWEWYSDINTFRLFIHLLLKANYKETSFQGHRIQRGQYLTSLTNLSADTGLTIRQVRDSLNKLEMTGEVTNSSCPRYRVITIVRYDEYQSSDKQNVSQMTNKTTMKCQPNDKQNDKQNDSETATRIDIIESQKDRNIENSPSESRGNAKRFTPPTPDEVFAFCQENGYQIDADRFCDYYAMKGWMIGKTKMKDWKAAVRTWVKRDREERPASSPAPRVIAQNYDQRDYTPIQDSHMADQERRVHEYMMRKGIES